MILSLKEREEKVTLNPFPSPSTPIQRNRFSSSDLTNNGVLCYECACPA